MGRKANLKKINSNSNKRAQLAKSAFPYFQKEGVKNFKMDELAKLLGKSKTTIYKHFIGREDLVDFIINKKLIELSSYENYLFDDSIDYLHRYELCIQHIGKVLAGISNKFLLEVSEIYPELWDKVRLFKQNALENLSRYYLEGQKLGIIKNIDPFVLLATDKLFLESLLSSTFLEQSSLSLDCVLGDYFRLKCYGMALED